MQRAHRGGRQHARQRQERRGGGRGRRQPEKVVANLKAEDEVFPLRASKVMSATHICRGSGAGWSHLRGRVVHGAGAGAAAVLGVGLAPPKQFVV